MLRSHYVIQKKKCIVSLKIQQKPLSGDLFKNGIVKDNKKFTEKRLLWSLFLTKVAC